MAVGAVHVMMGEGAGAGELHSPHLLLHPPGLKPPPPSRPPLLRPLRRLPPSAPPGTCLATWTLTPHLWTCLVWAAAQQEGRGETLLQLSSRRVLTWVDLTVQAVAAGSGSSMARHRCSRSSRPSGGHPQQFPPPPSQRIVYLQQPVRPLPQRLPFLLPRTQLGDKYWVSPCLSSWRQRTCEQQQAVPHCDRWGLRLGRPLPPLHTPSSPSSSQRSGSRRFHCTPRAKPHQLRRRVG